MIPRCGARAPRQCVSACDSMGGLFDVLADVLSQIPAVPGAIDADKWRSNNPSFRPRPPPRHPSQAFSLHLLQSRQSKFFARRALRIGRSREMRIRSCGEGSEQLQTSCAGFEKPQCCSSGCGFGCAMSASTRFTKFGACRPKPTRPGRYLLRSERASPATCQETRAAGSRAPPPPPRLGRDGATRVTAAIWTELSTRSPRLQSRLGLP